MEYPQSRPETWSDSECVYTENTVPARVNLGKGSKKEGQILDMPVTRYLGILGYLELMSKRRYLSVYRVSGDSLNIRLFDIRDKSHFRRYRILQYII